MPTEHKKLVRYITKQEKVNRKKKEDKKLIDQIRTEEYQQEKEKKKKQNRDIDEEDDFEPAQLKEDPRRVHHHMGDMETENAENNNLLLKFDTMVKFFLENSILKFF